MRPFKFFVKPLATLAMMMMSVVSTYAQTVTSQSFRPQSVRAQTITPETVTIRIDQAAKQRMLLERMAKSMCFASAGVHVWDNELSLQGAYISFTIAHRGIAFGDEKLGLQEDTNRNFRTSWENVDLMWVTLRRLYDGFVETKQISQRDFDNVMLLTKDAYAESDRIVIQIRSAYTKFIGSGGLGSSILLDLYNRQKELSQRLSKLVCLVSRGINTAENLPALNETLRIFDVSLEGFRNGLPAAGIKPPPTKRLKAQLDRVNDRWQEIRHLAETVSQGGSLKKLEMADFEFEIDLVLREIEKSVFLLSDHLANSG